MPLSLDSPLPHSHKRARKVVSSDSSEDELENHTHKSSFLKRPPKRQRNHTTKPARRPRKRSKDSDSESSDLEPDKDSGSESENDFEDYLIGARAVTRCNDMFCNAGTVIKTILYLRDGDSDTSGADESENSAGNGEDPDPLRMRRKAYLSKLSSKTIERCKKTYQTLIHFAPELKTLICNPAKSKELRLVIKKINKAIKATRSDDAAHLKDKIGNYVAPNPSVAISPPIYAGGGSKSQLGLNHPVLSEMLCPITVLQEFLEDPAGTRQKLQSGQIRFNAEIFPSFFWEENGKKFDLTNMHSGLFRNYFLERLIRHFFTGPSTSFGDEPRGTRPSNADLHGMDGVKATHIAYTCVQAPFSISSRSRWTEKDGDYSYRELYYMIIDEIEDCPDVEWRKSLMEHYNLVLFKNKSGRKHGAESAKTGHHRDANGFLASLRAQATARISGTTNGHVERDTTTGPPLEVPDAAHQPQADAHPGSSSEAPSAPLGSSRSTLPHEATPELVQVVTPPPTSRHPETSRARPTSPVLPIKMPAGGGETALSDLSEPEDSFVDLTNRSGSKNQRNTGDSTDCATVSTSTQLAAGSNVLDTNEHPKQKKASKKNSGKKKAATNDVDVRGEAELVPRRKNSSRKKKT